MKKAYSFFTIVSLLLLSLSCQRNESIFMYQTDPLYKVLKERSYFVDEVDTILAARGEVASLQIVVKAMEEVSGLMAHVEEIKAEDGVSALSGAEAGWVGYGTGGAFRIVPPQEISSVPPRTIFPILFSPTLPSL